LVSYNEKHNEANGEDNKDGESHNRSWNCGVEGETDDLDVIALREQQKRNFLTTLFLSQGVPMLLHGDELGRTQHGNNNVYAQDNELAWVDWERARDFEYLTEFVGRIARLRSEHPVFRRRRFFKGRPVKGTPLEDIGWFKPDGDQMSDDDWESGFAKSVAVFLNGDGIREPDARGERLTDQSFFLLFNAHHESIEFAIPDLGAAERWHVIVDTHAPMLTDVDPRAVKNGETLDVEARSIVVLQQVF
jgi:isoamylase